MAEPARMPRKYLLPVACTMRPGDVASFSVEDVCVDASLGCWVKPTATFAAVRRARAGSPPEWDSTGLVMQRTDDGFRLFLGPYKGQPLRVGATPEPIGGMGWIPVVEILEKGEPTLIGPTPPTSAPPASPPAGPS
jgi:hypothetical protein